MNIQHISESLNQLVCTAQSEVGEFHTAEQIAEEVEIIKESLLNLIEDE